MSGVLPSVLVAAAFGIALANARASRRGIALAVFVVIVAVFAPIAIPDAARGAARFAGWIAIVVCCASVHLPHAFAARATIGLAAVAGFASGVVSVGAEAIVLPPIAAATCVTTIAVAARVPLAARVVSSWLIAVALLAATLQTLPVTPGYQPDHLE